MAARRESISEYESLLPGLLELLREAGALENTRYMFSVSLVRTDTGIIASNAELYLDEPDTPAEPLPDSSQPVPSHDALLSLWDTVVAYRDKHTITCAETVHQTDKIMETATTLIEDCLDTVGYGHWDPETDDYVGGRIAPTILPEG